MVSMRSLFAYFWKDQPRVLYFVFCCCLVLLLAYWKRNQLALQLKNKIVFPAILLIVVFGNPVSAHILVTKVMETQSLRFFWLIPVSLFLATATVMIVDFIPKRWLKIVVAIVVIPILLFSGRGLKILRLNWQNNTPNWYKIPPVVIDLCDYILADDTYSEKSVACCFPLNLWVRQYTSEIYLPFSWSGGENHDLMKAMELQEGKAIDLNLVGRLSAKKSYGYIVLPREQDYFGSLESYGYREIYSIDINPESDENVYDREYVLFRLEERSGS